MANVNMRLIGDVLHKRGKVLHEAGVPFEPTHEKLLEFVTNLSDEQFALVAYLCGMFAVAGEQRLALEMLEHMEQAQEEQIPRRGRNVPVITH